MSQYLVCLFIMTPILLKTTTDNQYFIYKRNILSEMKSSNCSIIINQI